MEQDIKGGAGRRLRSCVDVSRCETNQRRPGGNHVHADFNKSPVFIRDANAVLLHFHPQLLATAAHVSYGRKVFLMYLRYEAVCVSFRRTVGQG